MAMKWTTRLLAAAAAVSAAAAEPATETKTPQPDQDGKYWIHGDGISAAFIPYGASITNLVLEDRHGLERDLVAGFDTAAAYAEDEHHPHYGGVPGRYANRIRNSTFAIDGVEHHVAPNEHPTRERPGGVNTLHGGPNGWDYRVFGVESHSRHAVVFSLADPDGSEGFPGGVAATIRYALRGRDWDIKMVARATGKKKTPIMLTSHTYWNLDGFANTETNTVLEHALHMPFADQRIGVDTILVPTGDILANKRGGVNDFWSAPRKIGALWHDEELEGNCGLGCTGYDNCYINRRGLDLAAGAWLTRGPVTSLSSDWSGIRLDVFSDQDAIQMYSCNGQDGSMPLKKTQGAEGDRFPRTIPKHGCVVLEVQDYIDGINHPEWGRGQKQIFGPGDGPYVLEAKYRFSVGGDGKEEEEVA